MRKSFLYPLNILAFFILQACHKPVDVIIDNPTKERIDFELDGKAISIDPKTTILYKSHEGQHELKIGGKEKEFGLSAVKHKDALINPTESAYILKEFLYQMDGDSIDLAKLNNVRRYANRQRSAFEQLLLIDTVEIGGIEFSGLYARETDIVIRKRWDLSLNEAAPEYITKQFPAVMSGNNGVQQFTEKINGNKGQVKLYREMDLLEEMYYDYRKAQERQKSFATEVNQD